MEYLIFEGKATIGVAYIESILKGNAISPLENFILPVDFSLDPLMAIASPENQQAIGVARATFQEHVQMVFDSARPTAAVTLNPTPVTLVEYSQQDSSPDTCGYYPEHSDICLATRNGWAFAKTVKPVCFPNTLPQIPWSCTQKGQTHFYYQSLILGVEKNLSTTPTALRPARCAEIAPKAVIEMWWQLGSLALFFSAQEFSCLYDPTIQTCGPYPYLSPSDFKYLMTWWIIFGDVHISAISGYPRHNLPSGNPLTFFQTTLDTAQMKEAGQVESIAR